MITAILYLIFLDLTILQLLKKWGLLDWYAAKYGHLPWLPKADCYLCFAFHLTVFVTGPLYLMLWLIDSEFLLIPLVVPGIVNILMTLHDKN